MDLMDRYLGIPVPEKLEEMMPLPREVKFETPVTPVPARYTPASQPAIPDSWEKYRQRTVKKIRTSGYYHLIKQEREQHHPTHETVKLDWEKINHKVDMHDPPNQLIGPRIVTRGDKILTAY